MRTVTPHAAKDLAAEAVRSVLATQWDGQTAVRLDSPPGAGKTRLVEDLAVQSYAHMRERVMIVTQTNEQAFDLARRLASRFPRYLLSLFVRRELAIPRDVLAWGNVVIVNSSSDLPRGACITIANATKWSYIRGLVPGFDLQIVDEAFQLPDYRFHMISGLANRIMLVGDPGQIAPVITCEVERWRSDPAGPHVPCPEALVVRHPSILRLSLPVSRRLPDDTVKFVQPAFYPNLSFQALSKHGERGLTTAARGVGRLDPLIDMVRAGASIGFLELPRRITGELDEEVVNTIVSLARRLLERGTHIRDDRKEYVLEPRMIGVVCAHVSQVNAVQERLPPELSEIFVETSDRFQGLERPVMIVYHPLSGRSDGTAFHLDAGRLCVMLSRHRVACFLVARGGLTEMLLRYAPAGARALGVDDDDEFRGWAAHLGLLQELERAGRIVSLNPAP